MDKLSTEDKEVTYAFNVIKDFFNDIHLYEAISDTEHLIRAAASSKVYKKRIPSDLLFFRDRFEQLISTAFSIRTSYLEREGALIDFDDEATPDISRQKDFMSALRHQPAWAVFPRSLTRWQYFNPYKAIKKFSSHMTEVEWKKALKVIVDYALTDCPVDDEYPSCELLSIRLRMLQLIEACHLLHVRTNLKEKHIKDKISKSKKK